MLDPIFIKWTLNPIVILDQKIQMLTTESEMCLFICVFVFIWISVSQKYFVLFHTLYQIHPKTYTQTSQKYQNLYPKKNQSFHTNTSRLFCFEKIHMSFSMIPGRAFVTNPLSFIDNMGQEISVFILATLMCNRTIVCPIFTWITTTPTLAMKLPFF